MIAGSGEKKRTTHTQQIYVRPTEWIDVKKSEKLP